MNIQELTGEVDNSKFTTTKYIFDALSRIYKSQSFSLADITEWCGEFVSKVCDANSMVIYEEDEFTVQNGMVKLPCNLHRVLDVYYNKDDSGSIMEHLGNNGSYLYGFPDIVSEGDIVYIDYIAMPITTDGNILIPVQYEIACRKYCMIQLKEDDVINGQFPADLHNMWKQEMSGMIIAAKQLNKHKTTSDFTNLLRIRGTMINKLGFTTTRRNQNYHI